MIYCFTPLCCEGTFQLLFLYISEKVQGEYDESLPFIYPWLANATVYLDEMYSKS